MANEVNFDGLIGPTHHFAGLAHGNVASMTNRGRVSNPKNGALQGLRKMKKLHDLGFKQAVLAPVGRPDFSVLRNLGFTGSKEQMLKQLSKQPIEFISAFFSASSMWTANAATVSPSSDTEDAKVHITPANLTAKFHRALEPRGTSAILKAIFKDQSHFMIHDPVFANVALGDEGAANHTRFCGKYGEAGLEFFVYGRVGLAKSGSLPEPKRFPARQTLEASQAVARLHGLKEERVVFAQQDPEAIDAGAFHNDVVAVGNRNVLFYHEKAFLDEQALIKELQTKFAKLGKEQMRFERVTSKDVPLADVITSYLFNSQLLTTSDGKTLLLAPIESQENKDVSAYLKAHVGAKGSNIDRVEFVDLRESMLNGGGPACLRLRVVLTDQELKSVNPGVLFTDELHEQLEAWVNKHYRDRLESEDLCDPKFVAEVEAALDELTRILKLGSVYPFQN